MYTTCTGMVLSWLLLLQILHAAVIESTSTRTEVNVQTLTHTLVALGGIIQNVQIVLDNGGPSPWQYSTQLVTGESVISIIPQINTQIDTVYILSDSVVTTSTSLITGAPAKTINAKDVKMVPAADQHWNVRNLVQDLLDKAEHHEKQAK